jgi:hypothetical protein
VTPLTVGMVNHELDNLVQAKDRQSRAKVFVQLFSHLSSDNVRALSQYPLTLPLCWHSPR